MSDELDQRVLGVDSMTREHRVTVLELIRQRDTLWAQRNALFSAVLALDAVIDLRQPWKSGDLGIKDVTAINAALAQLIAAIAKAEGCE
jgi:hypothetical protein